MSLFESFDKENKEQPISKSKETNDITFNSNTSSSDNQSSFVFSGDVLITYKNKKFCGKVCIPSFVTKISDEAFKGCALSAVIIPEKCTYIGKYAFSSCSNLHQIEFPHSKDRLWIDDFAFSGCNALKEIYLPDYYQIGCNCFELCSNLIKVRFDKQIETIGKAMFKDCTSLVDIILPENLFSIQMQAFSGCTSLSSILLPENLERILWNIFENCLSLTQIRIPSKIKCIPSYTFFGCRMLQSIDISDGVAIIENNAFQNCNIESVYIPPSVFNLGDKAFDSHTIVKGYQKRSTIFPDSPEDIIGFPTIGEHVKPIYYRLFSIEPNLGYDVAWVAINLMTGYLHRIDSKQVCYGVVVTGEDNVSGLSFDCLHEIGSHTQYREMTSENWKEYIPHEELEKAEKNVLKERNFDNSFTSSDNIEIDGLYIKLIQRFSTVAFYFRKTQTGYRLYSARTSGPHNLLLFDESRCNESFLYSHFVSPIIDSFTYADEEKDILLNKIEFLTILSSAPDLFSGKYRRYFGKKKSIKVPVSIYGDDIIEAVFWKNNKEIPCADYPGIKKIYDVLCKIK